MLGPSGSRHPLWGCCARPQPGKGGLAARLRGCARLAAQCAGLLRRCSACTRAMGLMSLRLGAFFCGNLRLVAALILGPGKGGAPPEGHRDGNCAVDRGSSCTPHFLALVRRRGGSRVHRVVCAVLYSFLGVLGLQLVRSAYRPGALDVSCAPSGLLRIHHGGLARAGISRVRTVAEHPMCRRIVGGVVWGWS